MKKCQLDRNKIISIFGEGSESTVYSYKEGENKYVALKLFKDEFVTPSKKEPIPYEVFQNKERKLMLLSNSDLIDETSKPINLYYEGDKFVGYSLYIDRLRDFSYYYSSSKKTKIELLKQLRDIVVKLNNNGIYIGDFNTENFGIRDDGSIKLRDIDNYSVGGLDFDRPTNLVKEYKKRCSDIKNIDVYSFNYFSLGYILAYEPYALNKYIEEHGLPRRLNTEENKLLLQDLENIDDNFEPRFFIDSTKKRIIF